MGAISTKDKSSAPAVSKTSGYASDASADFHQIGGRGDKNTSTKLDAAFFAHNPTTLKAIIQHGQIYSDGQEVDITWDEELLNVTIDWSDKCNLSGEPGLACSNGKGYAGWDDQHSAYLPYDKTIHKNESCMRITEFSPLESDSDSDDSDSESTTCSYLDSKLKKCGKKLAASSRFCLEHSKTSKKKKKTPEPEPETPEPEKKTSKKKKKTPEPEPETPEPEPEKKTSKKKKKTPEPEPETPEPEPEKKTSKKKTPEPEPETPEPEPEKKTSKKKTDKKKTPEPEKKTSISQDILDLLTASIRDQLTTEMGASMAAKVMSVLSQEKSQTTFLEIIESNIPETPSEKKGKKKKKDGPKSSVKGRRSSYIFFCSAEREKIKSTTDLKGADITKEMGVRWSKLSD